MARIDPTALGAAQGGSSRGPAVIGVVGRSGSGKTSLLEHLIPSLSSRGLAVGAVKHTSHGFLADHPGKDSHRLYESGAESVALISRQQLATFTRRGGVEEPDPRLSDALAALPGDLDVVLVEGFSWEPIPRFVLVPDSEQPIAEHLAGGAVLRIVKVLAPREGRKPEFARTLIDSLADEAARLAAEAGARGAAVCSRGNAVPDEEYSRR